MTQLASTGRASPSEAPPLPPPRTAEERIMVAVRIRPLRNDEGPRVVHSLSDKVVILDDVDQSNGKDKSQRSNGGRTNGAVAAATAAAAANAGGRQYVYDATFGEDATQEAVYDGTTRGLVGDVLRGVNGTVFAYGATGAGKTHTMMGSPSQPGIMVRALNQLFATLHKEGRAKVSMSYLEIYNENIRDLLSPSGGSLELREDVQGRGVRVAGLTEKTATSTAEVMALLQQGNRARAVESTAANKTSSRSHALLSVTVQVARGSEAGSEVSSSSGTGTGTGTGSGPTSNDAHVVSTGRLFMIDLAGSERAAHTRNRGRRLQEGAHINRSLLALANCINALSGGARYVNFRDSKLTRLLKDALSGNCRTVMIAHVSPSARHVDETRNTLTYAQRASSISTKVGQNVTEVSYHASQYRHIISDLRNEIARLRTKMEVRSDAEGGTVSENGVRGGSEVGVHVGVQSGVHGNRGNADGSVAFNGIDAPFENQDPDVVTATATAMGLPTYRTREEDALENDVDFKEIKDEIVTTFREQMRLRRQLLDIDSDLLRLTSEADKHQTVLSRTNRLYQSASTTCPGSSAAEEAASSSPTQVALRALAVVEHERETLAERRAATERALEACRRRAADLEEQIPQRAGLALLLRVHELELEQLALHGERALRRDELRRRDLLLLRYDRQRQLCDEIITRQRRLIEDGRLALPADLHDLYQLYQREIQAAAFSSLTPYSAAISLAYGSIGSTFTADSEGYEFTSSSYFRNRRDRLPAIEQSGGERMYRRRFTSGGSDDIWSGAEGGSGEGSRNGVSGWARTSQSSVISPNSSAGSDWEVSPLPAVTGTNPTENNQLQQQLHQVQVHHSEQTSSAPVQLPPITDGALRRQSRPVIILPVEPTSKWTSRASKLPKAVRRRSTSRGRQR